MQGTPKPEPRYPRPSEASRHRQQLQPQTLCPWHSHWISSVDLRAPWAATRAEEAVGVASRRSRGTSIDRVRPAVDCGGTTLLPPVTRGTLSDGLPAGRSLRPVWLQDAKFAGSSVYKKDYQPGKYGRPFVRPAMRGSSELLWSLDNSDACRIQSVSRAAFGGYDSDLVQRLKQANDRAAKLTSGCVIAGSYNFAAAAADTVYGKITTPGLRMRNQLPALLPPLGQEVQLPALSKKQNVTFQL